MRRCESPAFICAYLLGGALLVWSPIPLTRPLRPLLTGFDSLMQNLFGLPPGFAVLTLEFLANVVLFVPPALFLALRMRPENWSIVVVVGIVCTITIEFVQLAFLPGRSATISDVIANSLGALIGALLSLRLRR